MSETLQEQDELTLAQRLLQEDRGSYECRACHRHRREWALAVLAANGLAYPRKEAHDE